MALNFVTTEKRVMEYTLHENLGEYVGTISNMHGFLHRSLDGAFDSKWCGYWVPPYKFLDYHAFKVNGIWLNEDTLRCTEYGEKIVHHHETDTRGIKEIVLTPEKLPGMKIELVIENKSDAIKAVRSVFEAGIDIRRQDEDIGPDHYEFEEKNSRLSVARDDKKLMISSSHSFSRTGGEYIKTHHPGEEQRCFVPGQLGFNIELGPGETEVIEIDLTSSDTRFSSMEKHPGSLEHEFGHCFRQAKKSMENLCYDRNGPGIIAGHPWFQNYWARDSFWTALGLIDAGHFKFVEDMLENFVDSNLPGILSLNDEGNELGREDTAPLFIIVSEHLQKYYGLSEKLEEARKEAMERLELDGNIVDHAPEGTWMDSLERGKAVDIQALWLEAARIMDDPRKDSLEKNRDAINTAVPLMFDHFNSDASEKELEKINGEFSSRFGARTLSAMDPAYSSDGYHTGGVWGLTTGWAAAANFKHGKDNHGESFLRKMAMFTDRNQPGALPEVVNAETGELLGCPEQAWSSGMFLHVIDSYMLGIKPMEDHLLIEPSGDIDGVRRNKRFQDKTVDLRFENGKVTVEDDELEAINTGERKFRIDF
ncbi:MAG: amylo-alpha-1,6-glucosidase [Candidatus Aenigmatarchaeota archaeon]